jgi:predicted nucleic acid-binding protein
MILYLDTSALVQLYIEESQHDHIIRIADTASTLTTHLIAYTEMRAALARMQRMRRLNGQDHRIVRQAFEADWIGMEIIQTHEPLIRRAGDLAEEFKLRGYDSVHLAAAELVAKQIDEFIFACFDNRLNSAALALGMDIINAS